MRLPTAQSATPPDELVNNLSYAHLERLCALSVPLERTFYELECIRGQWSVRDLKHRIASL